jgi:hypothetical protein
MFEGTIRTTPKHYLGTPKNYGRNTAKIINYYPFSRNTWIVAKKCLKKE